MKAFHNYDYPINHATKRTGKLELLIMSCFERLVSGIVATSALTSLALCLTLIPQYGQVGAAIAATSGMSMQNLLMLAGVKSKLGFWPVGFSTQ